MAKSKWAVVATEGGNNWRPHNSAQLIEEWPKVTTQTSTAHASTLTISNFLSISWTCQCSLGFGDVLAVKAEEREDGKLQLLVELSTNWCTHCLNKEGQKVYTSVEMRPLFADTGKAYLVGLAVTDNPASLAQKMLSFSHNGLNARKLKGKHLHSSRWNGIGICWEEAEKSPSVLEKSKRYLRKKEKSDDERFEPIQCYWAFSRATKEILENWPHFKGDFENQQADIEEMTAGNEEIHATFEELKSRHKPKIPAH